MLRPNSDMFRGIFGLPGPNQNQNAKLTVVMCCQIVARKSVAPSSGDFRRRPAPRYVCGHIKKIITPLPRPQPDLPKCETSMIFQGLLVFFAWRAWRGGPQLKISLRFFFVFKKSFFPKTSW